MVYKNSKSEGPGLTNEMNIHKWWSATAGDVYSVSISKLPPLGDAILKLLISQYGVKEVAKAAQVFVEIKHKELVLLEAKKEVNRMLEKIKEINND